MRLYRIAGGAILENDGAFVPLADDWDALINHQDLVPYLRSKVSSGRSATRVDETILAPVGGQEVWGAGVTYQRSRTARIEESENTGGATFYDRVYEAERPELFFKAAGWRVRGPEQAVRLRRDAGWTVPEPELALCINSRGRIVGYTIGNDVSSRDIEGENPLYLPQAKIYDGSCALGPALLVREESLPKETGIAMRILRSAAVVYEGSTTLAMMRRTPELLVEYLYRETSFPVGCILLTGTGVIPPADFTLRAGDVVEMTVPPIGTLINRVE